MLHRLNNVNGLNILKCSYYSAYGIYIYKTHVLNVLCTMTFLNVKVMPERRAGTKLVYIIFYKESMYFFQMKPHCLTCKRKDILTRL